MVVLADLAARPQKMWIMNLVWPLTALYAGPFASGLVLLGSTLFTHDLVSFVLAYVFGIFFQYFAIAPMRGLGFREGLWAAVKADTLSLTACEIGMFAWMAVTQKLLFPGLEPRSWTFWFMMQIAMILGLATTFPANWWLIRRGGKEAM